MKKFFALLFSTLMLATVGLFGCGTKIQGDFTFYAPDGAPALSIAKFIKDGENFGVDGTFGYSVVSANSINSYMVDGSADFIIMPITNASNAYKNNANEVYKAVSVVTHGNLYVVSKQSQNITSLSDLVGKVVGGFGKLSVPGLTIMALLEDNDIEYTFGDVAEQGKVVLNFAQSFPQVVGDIRLLPEPQATKVANSSSDWEISLDIQELYDGVSKTYPQAVLMAKSSILEKYPQLVNKMQEKFAANVQWVVENPQQAVDAVNSVFDGTSSLNSFTINSDVVNRCNISWKWANDNKTQIKSYIDKVIAVVNTPLDTPVATKIEDDFFFVK